MYGVVLTLEPKDFDLGGSSAPGAEALGHPAGFGTGTRAVCLSLSRRRSHFKASTVSAA